jgi:hypothetical protein
MPFSIVGYFKGLIRLRRVKRYFKNCFKKHNDSAAHMCSGVDTHLCRECPYYFATRR